MIKNNGYYCKIKPSYYEDTHAGYKTTYFIFDAYWFRDNGKVWVSSKRNDFLFDKSKFRKDSYIGDYKIDGDKLNLLFEENTIHETNREFQVISSNLIKQESNRIYLYIPWADVDISTKED